MSKENTELRTMAVFCDFENVAIGAREAKYAKFDIGKVIERLLLKGNIVVKKAYCDWDRYKTFKKPMHEAAFELIEIPHVRMSGKNSADIRMVVDALDLCYTKSHVDAFVIISGDSDFSPLVSKLRENNKLVIGVGVKHSTSDLFVDNCDEFLFYDDLVRKLPERKPRPRAGSSATKAADKTDGKSTKKATSNKAGKKDPVESPNDDAITLMLETFSALVAERDAGDHIWGSMIKQALKRQKPGFNETHYGYRSFSELLEEAREQGQVTLELDQKSGGYIVKAAV